MIVVHFVKLSTSLEHYYNTHPVSEVVLFYLHVTFPYQYDEYVYETGGHFGGS